MVDVGGITSLGEQEGEQQCYQVVSPPQSPRSTVGSGTEGDQEYRQVTPGSIKVTSSDARGVNWGLVVLKLMDLLFSIYLVGLLIFSLVINTMALLGQVGPPSSRSGNFSWLETNVTVLGKEKWTMSFSHFTLIFSIFHVVYALIATICDLFFFHCLFKKMMKARYIPIVLPVHRLFFSVISWFDCFLFVFSTNITPLLGDMFLIFLLVLVSLVVSMDTALLLPSLRTINSSKSRPGWRLPGTPWRQLILLITIIASSTHSLVSCYLGSSFSWEIWPGLAWSIVSVIIYVKIILEFICRRSKETEERERQQMEVFLCISGSNVLGLVGVGAVVHQLMLDCGLIV